MINYVPLRLNASRMNNMNMLWSEHLSFVLFLTLRPEKALKDGTESLPCKSRENTRCRALQVLIRGNDSKDRLIRMEPPFLPTLNSSAVWCMSGPAASPALSVSWKIGISLEEEFGKGSFLFMFLWTNMYRSIMSVCL